MGVPVVLIVMPFLGIVAYMNLLNHQVTKRFVLVFLYIGINVPYTTIFLLTFWANLSKTYEEAAAIDGCSSTRLSVVLQAELKVKIQEE